MCIETKWPQNLDKNINSLLISTKKFLPKNSSQKNPPKNPPKKISPKQFLQKYLSKKIPPKKSSQKISKKFPKKSKKFLKKFLKDRICILFFYPRTHPRTLLQGFALYFLCSKAKHCRNFLGRVLGWKNKIQCPSLRFWKYPITYISLRGQKPFRGFFFEKYQEQVSWIFKTALNSLIVSTLLNGGSFFNSGKAVVLLVLTLEAALWTHWIAEKDDLIWNPYSKVCF